MILRSLALLAVVAGVIGASAWLGTRSALLSHGAPVVYADSMGRTCPRDRPVYVAAYERGDGTMVRAHCRGKPGGWW